VFTAGAIASGLLSTKAFAQVEGELSPGEEIRLVQEFNRMLAEGINPGEIWYEVSNPEDKGAKELVKKWYEPYEKEFNTVIGTANTLLYKRDTVFSTWDRLIGEALADYYHGVDAVMSLDVGTSPGFRWGTTVLPGQKITVEHVYDVLGMTYPQVFIMKRKGRELLALWEDVADNVFNPNPLYQQGGDMSRIYGVEYELKINARQGERIRNVKIKGKPIEMDIDYIRKKKNIEVDRRPNVKVLDHPYNTDCYWR